MRFLRRRSEIAVLALVGLVLQMLLAFGHSHAQHEVASAAVIVCQAATEANRSCPNQHSPNQHHDCAICWSVAIASSAALGSAATLSLPTEPAFTVVIRRDPFSVRDERAAAFEPRGPPVSMAS